MTTDTTETTDFGTSRWVRGTKQPVRHELDVAHLRVDGAIPSELNGRLARIGPNPAAPVDDDYVWFGGDGMVHAIDISDGVARRYVNRWVRTVPASTALGEHPGVAEVEAGADVANTNVVEIGGRLHALTETCPPYVLDADLRTVGRSDFGGGVTHFTAHPHVDPHTGDVHGIGYRTDLDPTCTIYVIGRDGVLREQAEIELLGPRSVHDVAVTERFIVVWDLPLEVQADAPELRFPFAWNRAGGARVGLIDRSRLDQPPIWHEIEACWVFHPLNAYDTAEGGVVVDVCQFDRVIDTDRTGPGDPYPPQLWRWELDGRGGEVSRTLVDERIQEFPRGDERFWGRPHTFGLSVELLSRNNTASLLAHDLRTGTTQSWETAPGHSLSEAVFVPASDTASEGEGWALTIDSSTEASSLCILDATALADGPIARVELPQRIPDGFHGNWTPAHG